jgi:hypothetical protein
MPDHFVGELTQIGLQALMLKQAGRHLALQAGRTLVIDRSNLRMAGVPIGKRDYLMHI